jgi:hypothetical protein
MYHRRIGRQLRRRPDLAVSGNRAVDQFRIDACNVIVELQPRITPGRKFSTSTSGRDQPAGLKPWAISNQDQAVLADIELAEGGGAVIPTGGRSA